MTDLILTTYDWVPDMPRGYVRDLRVRWALEEAGLPYRVESTPFRDRKAAHFAHQPFGQVPWLTDGDISIFESGAILLHLGERSEALMPADPRGRSEVIQWLFAALIRSRRQASPGPSSSSLVTPTKRRCGSFLTGSSRVTGSRIWRRSWRDANGWPEPSPSPTSSWPTCCALWIGSTGWRTYPACRAYVARATARPSFVKAHADQMAHFAAAD